MSDSNDPRNSGSINNVNAPLVPVRHASRPVADLMEVGEYGGPSSDYYSGSVSPRTPSVIASLRRNRLMMSLIFLAVAVVGIPPIWLLIVPKYRATAVVQISPVVDIMVFKNDRASMPLQFYQAYLNTQVAIIRSPALLERTLDQQAVKDTYWYKHPPRSFFGKQGPVTIDMLASILQVSPRMGTELIDVSVEVANAKDAKEIVNTIAAEYKKLTDEKSKASDTNLYETLTRELSRLQNEINGQIETKYNISSTLGTTSPEELRSQYSMQLSLIESQRNVLNRDLKILEWQLARITAANTSASAPASGPSGEESLAHRAYSRDIEWRRLDQGLEEAKARLASASSQYGEAHPRIRELKEQVEFQKKLRDTRQNQLDSDWEKNLASATTLPEGTMSPELLTNLIAKKKRELELMEEDIKRQSDKVTEASQIAQEIARYDEQIAQKRELREAVRKRLDVIEMEGKAPARVRIAAYALEPSEPDQDRRLILTGIVLVFAFGLSLGCGYLRFMLDQRIYEPTEVQSICQVPFLGWLPKIDVRNLPRDVGGYRTDMPAEGAGKGYYYYYHSPHQLMEHVRIIRTALLERINQSGERVLLITSSVASTGKTSVAVLLAKSLAMVGKKVLLVEGDLRRPVLAQRLDLEPQPGLASLLCGQLEAEAAIQSSGLANFDVLAAGPIPTGFSPELLANGVFRACSDEWRKKYDYVLLDSPPILPVADAQILAAHADGTVMILRCSHDRRQEATEALTQLVTAGGRLLGTILIGGPPTPRRRETYGYDYQYKYDYYYYSPPRPTE